MPDLQSQLINLVSAGQVDALRRENALAQDIITAYDNARADLLGRLAERWHLLLDDNATPAQIRQIATDINLARAIEARLAQLERELGAIVRPALTDIAQAAFGQAGDEVLFIANALGISLLPFAVDDLLELTVAPAMEQIPGLIASLRSQLIATLREQLASGERFSVIVEAVYGGHSSIFARGRSSAELMIRRAVVQAENNARLLDYEQARTQIPDLQKQVVAKIGEDTTETCLNAHGQIQPLDKPFVISGRPSFGPRQMAPPFHWNCRSMAAPYHPLFERTSSLTTPAMQAAAQAELTSR